MKTTKYVFSQKWGKLKNGRPSVRLMPDPKGAVQCLAVSEPTPHGSCSKFYYVGLCPPIDACFASLEDAIDRQPSLIAEIELRYNALKARAALVYTDRNAAAHTAGQAAASSHFEIAAPGIAPKIMA